MLVAQKRRVLSTRFYASQEAANHACAKARMVAASGEDTLRSVVFNVARRNVWPAPYTGRCFKNAYTDRRHARTRAHAACLRGRERFQAAQNSNDFDIAPVIAGEVVGLVRDIPW
jgi:nitronate monooxygenase